MLKIIFAMVDFLSFLPTVLLLIALQKTLR